MSGGIVPKRNRCAGFAERNMHGMRSIPERDEGNSGKASAESRIVRWRATWRYEDKHGAAVRRS